MTDIQWVEGEVSRQTDWGALLRPLMKHPERWAVIAEKDTPNQAWMAATNLRRRQIRTVPEGRWEFRGETRHDNGAKHGVVLARYLGPEK